MVSTAFLTASVSFSPNASRSMSRVALNGSSIHTASRLAPFSMNLLRALDCPSRYRKRSQA